jgi:two-component system chemotaxis sensor kinase CheA
VKLDPVKRKERIKSMGDVNFLDQGGELYQLVDLGTLIQNNPSARLDPELEWNVVLVRTEGLIYGLLVEAIEDAEEVVVKRLAPQIRAEIFLGSTFLDNGQVGLIIDTQGVADKLRLGHDERSSEGDAASENQAPRTDYLVFQIGVSGRYALPLADVFRLEDLNPQNMAQVGGQLTMIYRDRVMPLTIVQQVMGLTQDRGLLEAEKVPAIICHVNGQYHALLVSRISEIISSAETMDTSLDLGPCIRGSLIDQKKVLTILNVYQLLGMKEPLPRAENPVNQQEAAKAQQGWGLF